MTQRLLIDTNVLVYSRDEESEFHIVVGEALRGLVVAGVELCIHQPILREYAAVATRPRPRGLGAELEQVLNEIEEFEGYYHVLNNPDGVWALWKQTIKDAKITGLQVHDAFLAAVMKAHRIDTILTYNAKDFENLDGIEVAIPKDWRDLLISNEDNSESV